MIDRSHALPLVSQARQLGISRGSIYYLPRAVSSSDLTIMRRIDELHLLYPFAGSRMLRDLLRQEGTTVGRLHVATLMKGTVRISVCGRAVEHYAAMALMKRSPKMTANWALAMDHSRGGIFHSFSDRFKIR